MGSEAVKREFSTDSRTFGPRIQSVEVYHRFHGLRCLFTPRLVLSEFPPSIHPLRALAPHHPLRRLSKRGSVATDTSVRRTLMRFNANRSPVTDLNAGASYAGASRISGMSHVRRSERACANVCRLKWRLYQAACHQQHIEGRRKKCIQPNILLPVFLAESPVEPECH